MSESNNIELFQVSQKVILYDPESRKFLVLKEIDGSDGSTTYSGPWDLPGGRLHEGEDSHESLIRELKEEIGDVQYDLRDVVSINVLRVRNDPNGFRRLRTYSLAIYTSGDVKISDEHTEFRWESLENIIKNDEYEPVREPIVKAAKYLRNEEYLNDLKRVTADFDNYKKRQASEQKELSAHLVRSIVLDLIPILDNFHAAITHVPKEAEGSPWVTGITYIEKQFEDVLRNYGVEPLTVKPGDHFDPNIHEALDHQGDKDTQEKLTVEKVVQKGYKIKDKVVRAAKVIVK